MDVPGIPITHLSVSGFIIEKSKFLDFFLNNWPTGDGSRRYENLHFLSSSTRLLLLLQRFMKTWESIKVLHLFVSCHICTLINANIFQ